MGGWGLTRPNWLSGSNGGLAFWVPIQKITSWFLLWTFALFCLLIILSIFPHLLFSAVWSMFYLPVPPELQHHEKYSLITGLVDFLNEELHDLLL